MGALMADEWSSARGYLVMSGAEVTQRGRIRDSLFQTNNGRDFDAFLRYYTGINAYLVRFVFFSNYYMCYSVISSKSSLLIIDSERRSRYRASFTKAAWARAWRPRSLLRHSYHQRTV
jgi:hypothetical protein